MHWITLENEAQLAEIKNNSVSSLIFKHSTRCHISNMVLRSFEREWDEHAGIQTYFLDLLAYPHLSREVANIFQIHHESPQVLLIKNGECFFDASHNEISAQEILAEATTN
jgi:bacillithiol system protein YtxJ